MGQTAQGGPLSATRGNFAMPLFARVAVDVGRARAGQQRKGTTTLTHASVSVGPTSGEPDSVGACPVRRSPRGVGGSSPGSLDRAREQQEIEIEEDFTFGNRPSSTPRYLLLTHSFPRSDH